MSVAAAVVAGVTHSASSASAASAAASSESARPPVAFPREVNVGPHPVSLFAVHKPAEPARPAVAATLAEHSQPARPAQPVEFRRRYRWTRYAVENPNRDGSWVFFFNVKPLEVPPTPTAAVLQLVADRGAAQAATLSLQRQNNEEVIDGNGEVKLSNLVVYRGLEAVPRNDRTTRWAINTPEEFVQRVLGVAGWTTGMPIPDDATIFTNSLVMDYLRKNEHQDLPRWLLTHFRFAGPNTNIGFGVRRNDIIHVAATTPDPTNSFPETPDPGTPSNPRLVRTHDPTLDGSVCGCTELESTNDKYMHPDAVAARALYAAAAARPVDGLAAAGAGVQSMEDSEEM